MHALAQWLVKRLDQQKAWHELPTPAAILRLIAMRNELRAENLHDSRVVERGDHTSVDGGRELPRHRSYDGSGYDPRDWTMGMAGTRFGRNLAPSTLCPDRDVSQPNPRDVSEALLRRHTFQPATSLNMLAATWVQFQNHDWFSHGDNVADASITLELDAADDWPDRPMCVRRTRPPAEPAAGVPASYDNTVTHWWDGSQLYGSSEQQCRRLRTHEDGKLIVLDGRLPEDAETAGVDLTGFVDNYWVGLSMWHTLFSLEHNAICDRLRAKYSSWDDERLFQTARLVNVALLAKIHTIEWTPAMLAHPAVERGMHANWHGLLGAEFRRWFGRVGDSEVLSGIPGSATEHHTAPYSITEEFVTCYRLHPLLPDQFTIRSHRDGSLVDETGLIPLEGVQTRKAIDDYGMTDLFYSFGISHPGAVTLHNHPNSLRSHHRMTGEHVDLGTVDILRDRERGVPRYNAFREMVHKPQLSSFAELSTNPRWVAEIQDVYDGDIDAVDTLVGMYAEQLPHGFAFSDTAFRIFVLMASRRLKSDRFFTDDYRPEIYTPEGMAWIDRNDLRSIMLRHHPQLEPACAHATNLFTPWA